MSSICVYSISSKQQPLCWRDMALIYVLLLVAVRNLWLNCCYGVIQSWYGKDVCTSIILTLGCCRSASKHMTLLDDYENLFIYFYMRMYIFVQCCQTIVIFLLSDRFTFEVQSIPIFLILLTIMKNSISKYWIKTFWQRLVRCTCHMLEISIYNVVGGLVSPILVSGVIGHFFIILRGTSFAFDFCIGKHASLTLCCLVFCC